MMKNKSSNNLGIFIFSMAIIITLSGALIPIVIANKFFIVGLIERVNIFSLQLWIFILSIWLFKRGINEAL
jgi:hypothetical protein